MNPSDNPFMAEAPGYAYKPEPVVSFRKTRRVEEMVRRTGELDMKGIQHTVYKLQNLTFKKLLGFASEMKKDYVLQASEFHSIVIRLHQM